jgi:hypothetical protein
MVALEDGVDHKAATEAEEGHIIQGVEGASIPICVALMEDQGLEEVEWWVRWALEPLEEWGEVEDPHQDTDHQHTADHPLLSHSESMVEINPRRLTSHTVMSREDLLHTMEEKNAIVYLGQNHHHRYQDWTSLDQSGKQWRWMRKPEAHLIRPKDLGAIKVG